MSYYSGGSYQSGLNLRNTVVALLLVALIAARLYFTGFFGSFSHSISNGRQGQTAQSSSRSGSGSVTGWQGVSPLSSDTFYDAEVASRRAAHVKSARDPAVSGVARERITQCWAALNREDWAAASDLARQSDAAWPSATAAFYESDALQRQQRYPESLRCLEARRDYMQYLHEDQQAEWLGGLAAAYFFNSRYTECISVSKESCELYRSLNLPPDIYTLELQAYSLMELKRAREALAVLDESDLLRKSAGTRNAPEYVELRNYLLYETGQPAMSAAASRPSSSLPTLTGGEDDMKLLHREVPAMIGRSDFKGAMELIDRARAARANAGHGEDPWLLWQRANCQKWQRQSDEAVGAYLRAEEAYRKAKQAVPAELYFDEATCFFMRGEVKQCREAAKKARAAYKAEGITPPASLAELEHATNYGRADVQ